MSNTNSDVWNYFDKSPDNSEVFCKLCTDNNWMKYNQQTSLLHYHLHSQHQIKTTKSSEKRKSVQR